MLIQASNNCCLPAVPVFVGLAGMAELQICMVPFWYWWYAQPHHHLQFSTWSPPHPTLGQILQNIWQTSVMVPTKWLDLLEIVVEAWMSMPMVKESESTETLWGLHWTLESVYGDREGNAVLMTLGRWKWMGRLLPIRKVCPLLLGLFYLLQPRLWLYLFVFFSLCCP